MDHPVQNLGFLWQFLCVHLWVWSGHQGLSGLRLLLHCTPAPRLRCFLLGWRSHSSGQRAIGCKLVYGGSVGLVSDGAGKSLVGWRDKGRATSHHRDGASMRCGNQDQAGQARV